MNRRPLFTAHDQVAALGLGCIYLMVLPRYLEPEKAFQDLFGMLPRDNIDKFDTLVVTSYLGFFGAGCLLAAIDAKASRLTLLTQAVMSAFYLHAIYMIAPQLGVISDEFLTRLRRTLTLILATCFTSLLLDCRNASKKSSWNEYLPSRFHITPAQVGAFLAGCNWLLAIPLPFRSKKIFQDFHGMEPQSDIETLGIMMIFSLDGFFGLACVMAATDARAARIAVVWQLFMTLFYIRFQYVVTSVLGVFQTNSQLDDMILLHQVFGMTILLTTLYLDMIFHKKKNLMLYLQTMLLN